jgi:hypothetical protein
LIFAQILQNVLITIIKPAHIGISFFFLILKMRSTVISGCCLLLCFTAGSQTYNYYFGNLHAHTAFSDGNKDSASTGVGRPDGSYAYAKLSQDFDFLGISEHNHYNANHNPGFKLPCYQAGINMANAANQDGAFAALFGMEYGVSSTNNGHVVIYGFNQLIGWESNVGGQAGNNYNIFNAKGDYDGLFKKVKNNPAAFAYLAHPYWTDFTRNGDDSTAIAFSAYNAAYDSAIVGVPLRSGNAFSTFEDYSDYSTGDYFNYYKKMLYIGYHLGIGYDHDNHYTNFGRSNGGRLVILAPALTRANIITAMQHMHFYGSDDANAKIEFTMNGNIMGSVVTGNYYPAFNVVHNDADGEQADTIRIWRGNKNSGGLWAQTLQTVLHNNTATLTDHTIVPGIEYYYFAEIKQADGQWIVTSPIWYTASGNVSIQENNPGIVFNYFPNPVSKNVNISFSEPDDYIISILDISGRTVFENLFHNKNISIDLSELQQGIYTLRVKCKTVLASKKLVIE